MNPPLLDELPYGEDSAWLFESLASAPWSMFLDSGRPYGQFGRYDILCSEPTATLVTHGSITEISDANGTRTSGDDPFQLLREQLGAPGLAGDLPFAGGAMGYFAYDLAGRLESMPEGARAADALPDMVMAIYDWAVVVDHQERRAWLAGQGRDPRTRKRWPELLEQFRHPPVPAARPALRAAGPVTSNLSGEAYGEAFTRIQRYIRHGDCYQVNFAQRFSAPVEGDPWAGYRRLRARNPAPFAAFLNLPMAQILSASPERFVEVRAGLVETRPIKGTRPRHADPLEDAALARALAESAKDRAENLMIVDLLRNDLGKSCAVGSVRVPALFALESFSNVHHLVSTVQGRLAPGCDALALLRGCFPGGSITGAPKLRAMEIIEELEADRRGVYCGAIGYVGFDGQMDTNIAIRTAVHRDQTVRFWAGGGIVADSRQQEEYRETFDKAAGLLRWLGETE